ncbi:hypothetical protein EI164_00825 [Psychrobacter sp. FME13]|uniref:hypothetical protein n=1 Tax=Psychrobacter sp. FME13 TaxID=2487708 RepID=UPI0017881BAA|nr:hypothetical protein [Psychrobacter sp. FME13]MBE0440622.1 hypothetical protein [Psychrobacter sp. FME13]
MAETIEVLVTREWVQLAPSQCEVQSVNDRDAYNKTFFDLVVGGAEPASDTDVFMRITLAEHANFHRDAPVWLRLNALNADADQSVVVIR